MLRGLKRRTALLTAVVTVSISGIGCAGTVSVQAAEQTEVQLFVAASLNQVMTELAQRYEKDHPGVSLLINADSSGTLLTQIQEGYACDIFFSAAQKQMDTLEADGLILEGTRVNVLDNQVVLIARKDSGTRVTGLENLRDAESIALAGGSVPVGRYTRKALLELGILEQADASEQEEGSQADVPGQEEGSLSDASEQEEGSQPDVPEQEEGNLSETSEFDPALITTEEISEALGGVEISEQSNVSKVLLAVVEGSCEVGTAYCSDIYGYEDELDILEMVDSELTGEVSYPMCRVQNEEAGEAEGAAADGFYAYILSDEAKELFGKYYFIVSE